jgi:hypothetical protein
MVGDAKPIAAKKYVVRLGEEQRRRLNMLIYAGKHPARQLTKPSLGCSTVCILLKAAGGRLRRQPAG